MISRAIQDFMPASVSGDCYPWYLDIHVLAAAASASAAWPSANLAMFWPIPIPTLITPKQLFVANGGVVSGNFDIGIYTEAGVKIVTTGSTAQAGTTAPQGVAISNVALPRGRYWLGLSFDNGTAQVRRWTGVTNLGNINAFMGMAQMTSTFPLPTSITFAANTQNFMPLFGMSLLSLTM